jgi:hypothetical protein
MTHLILWQIKTALRVIMKDVTIQEKAELKTGAMKLRTPSGRLTQAISR